MKKISFLEMENHCSGGLGNCIADVLFTTAAFAGLGLCTAGVGWAVVAVASYATGLAGVVYDCSNV